MNSMKIAVAYKDGEIFEHFGHCECFAIYEYPTDDIADVKKVLINCADRHGHEEMAELMKQCNVAAVIAGNMGAEAIQKLLSLGIVPVYGYCGQADMAADLLVTGRLPTNPNAGGCGGGCNGCSGSCGGCGDDEDGCDCGCGCH